MSAPTISTPAPAGSAPAARAVAEVNGLSTDVLRQRILEASRLDSDELARADRAARDEAVSATLARYNAQ